MILNKLVPTRKIK